MLDLMCIYEQEGRRPSLPYGDMVGKEGLFLSFSLSHPKMDRWMHGRMSGMADHANVLFSSFFFLVKAHSYPNITYSLSKLRKMSLYPE